MTEARKVLILGDGEMGSALAALLGDRHDLRVWARDLDTWEENFPLEEALPDSEFIIFAIPAQPHAELAGRIAPHLPEGSICLTVAKGLDEQGRLPAEVFTELLGPGRRFGVVYGPMIAEELRRGRPGFARVGIGEVTDFRPAAALFEGSALYLGHTTDVIGLSWSVILKNVYVPLISAADALDLGANVRGYLVARAAEEIDRIAVEMGGRPGTAFCDAALGDLVTTVTSPDSHHRQIGRDLVEGRFDRIAAEGKNIRGEGIHTLMVTAHHQRFDGDRYPLFRMMRDIVEDPRAIKDRFDALLADLDRGA